MLLNYQFRINQGKKWNHNGTMRKSEHHNENRVIQYNIFKYKNI